MSVVSQEDDKNKVFDGDETLHERPPILKLDELNDKFVKDTSIVEIDPVKKVISTVFLCEQSLEYKQCGVALR
jgi:hypothetical protein